jgi:hypothetical protein
MVDAQKGRSLRRVEREVALGQNWKIGIMESEQFLSRQKWDVKRRTGNPLAHLGLDSRPSNKLEEQVCPGVVTDRDGGDGYLLNRHLSPVWHVLQRATAARLDGSGNGDLLAPADCVLVNCVGQRTQDEEFEHRPEGPRRGGLDRMHRSARTVGVHSGGEKPHRRGSCAQLFVYTRPRRRHGIAGHQRKCFDEPGRIDAQRYIPATCRELDHGIE